MKVNSISFLREEVSKELEKIRFSNHPPELYDPIYYMLGMGGKRIRPVLVLAACEMFGQPYHKAISAAIAIEIFHNFTLVHDDIMDEAPLRRGKDTVYKKWNTPIAILAGDTMLSYAYEFLIRLEKEKLHPILSLFNQTSIEVCEGQQLDMNFEELETVPIGDYIEMIRLKTAVLLGASLKMGGLVAGADTGDLEKLYQFGVTIGIAFQLKDDYLDVFGKQELFGKQESGDIVTNKKTFLYLQALEKASPDDRQKLKELYSQNLDDNEGKIKTVRGIFEKYSIDEDTTNMINRYHDEAISLLERIRVEEARKEVLRSVAGQIVERKF
jgi:geranylgeranyl diphosphate synthase type II